MSASASMRIKLKDNKKQKEGRREGAQCVQDRGRSKPPSPLPSEQELLTPDDRAEDKAISVMARYSRK